MDFLGLPSVNQEYVVPHEFAENPYDIHDIAIYSLWMHFVSFCENSDKNYQNNDRYDEVSYVDSPYSRIPARISSGSFNSYAFEEQWIQNHDKSDSYHNHFVPIIRRLPIFVYLANCADYAVVEQKNLVNSNWNQVVETEPIVPVKKETWPPSKTSFASLLRLDEIDLESYSLDEYDFSNHDSCLPDNSLELFDFLLYE